MKTLIAIPCLDMVKTSFMLSLLNLRKPPDTKYGAQINSLVYDARNAFSIAAINGGYDRVLWLDSDMTFEPDLLERLSADMDEHNLDYVCGLFFKRCLPTAPVIYKDVTWGPDENNILRTSATPYLDYPKDALFECPGGSGFGAVLTKTSMLKDVWDHYGPPFDIMSQLGEDLSFCFRARKLGYTFCCDSRVKVGHEGNMTYGEPVFLSQHSA